MELAQRRLCEDKAQDVVRSISDCIDLADIVDSLLRTDDFGEEETDLIHRLVSRGLLQYKLPYIMKSKSWVCAICNKVETYYGKDCGSCSRKERKENIPLVKGIGISEISNE